MINSSARPQAIGNIPRAFLQGLRSYRQMIERHSGPQASASKLHQRHYRAIALFDEARPCPSHDQTFLDAMCTLVQTNQRYYTPALLDAVYTGTKTRKRLSAEALASLRRLAKYVLYHMWATGSALLPASFKMEGSFSDEEMADVLPELAFFCRNFEARPPSGRSTYLRVTLHVARWIVCTGWRHPEDISLDDALRLHSFFGQVKRGESQVRWSSYFQGISMFLGEVQAAFPDRVRFTIHDLKTFNEYYARHLPEVRSFGEIKALMEQQKRASRERLVQRKARKAASRGRQRALKRESDDGEKSSSLVAHDIVYTEKRSRSGHWFSDVSNLHWLEVRLSDDAKARWEALFVAYKEYRSLKGYERFKSVEGSLRVLTDYMSICLPVFNHFDERPSDERHPRGCLIEAPLDFTRYPFVDRAADREFRLPTLREYIFTRFQSRQSRYSHLNAIRIFFEYVKLGYRDNPEVCGSEFRNPISKDFDLPSTGSGTTRKTNKKPFSRMVLPHLVQWLYAAEAFGICLRERGISVSHSGPAIIKTADYGFVPIYRHLGRVYPVYHLPRRIVADIDGAQVGGLTYCRMFILGLEAGLRFQSVQWLCRMTFDRLNVGRPDESDVFELWVNTDKTQNEFVTAILRRVRDMLLRQRQDEVALALPDTWIDYENEPNSRFEPLIPLFRNASTGQPVSDRSYATVWVEALAGFQAYHSTIAEFVRFIKVAKPKIEQVEWRTDGSTFCPLAVNAIYTPHSCRATFVTRRVRFLSLGDVADLVGHANERVTSHYDAPEFDELSKKLLYADQAVSAGDAAPPTISSGPAFIHAEAVNSNLQASFRQNRDTAIEQFGVIALSAALYRDDHGAHDALEVLRGSPLALIIFRETHICPVGEDCPAEVVKLLGARRRCGACPLACKSIDHLPAIAAKIRQLHERIQRNAQLFRSRKAAGAGPAELSELYDQIDVDTEEMLAWRVSEEVLWAIRQRFDQTGRNTIYVGSSELVQRHLQRVVRTSSAQQTILHRIMEANEYPTMATDWLRMQVNVLKRKLMADIGSDANETGFEHDPDDGIRSLASLLTTSMRANGYTLEQIAAAIQNPTLGPRSGPALMLDRPSMG